MHEIIEINWATGLVFALLLIFGLVALLSGLMIAWFGTGKSRAMGFLQMSIGWIALFILYMFFWNPWFFWVMIGVIFGVLIGVGIALGLMFVLLMKS